ncbi:hypothetical protein, partial [Enterovirga sp.]|uniref:hypothetical protein n=1 Tax=Enterovirga sp. TaxID=2026350 RepID=UPI002BC4F7FD
PRGAAGPVWGVARGGGSEKVAGGPGSPPPPHKAPPGCAASVVLDRDHLAGHGATTLRIVPSGILMESVRKPGPGRPWMPQPQAGARAPAGLPAQPPGAGGDEPGPEGKVP